MATHEGISHACRVAALLLIIPTIVCVGLGQYLCTKDGADDDTKCTTAWPITDWSNKPAGSQLNGQYYVFAAAIFIFLVLLLNFCGGLFPIKLNRKAVITFCALGCLVTLACFCLEAWYCSGFDVSKIYVAQYYQSWLAATVFFFIIFVLFLVDAWATYHILYVKTKIRRAAEEEQYGTVAQYGTKKSYGKSQYGTTKSYGKGQYGTKSYGQANTMTGAGASTDVVPYSPNDFSMIGGMPNQAMMYAAAAQPYASQSYAAQPYYTSTSGRPHSTPKNWYWYPSSYGQ